MDLESRDDCQLGRDGLSPDGLAGNKYFSRAIIFAVIIIERVLVCVFAVPNNFVYSHIIILRRMMVQCII